MYASSFHTFVSLTLIVYRTACRYFAVLFGQMALERDRLYFKVGARTGLPYRLQRGQRLPFRRPALLPARVCRQFNRSTMYDPLV
jgi:hypothetical protein